MSVAGIDPGMEGGIAILCDDGGWVVFPMPLVGNQIEVAKIASEMRLLEVRRAVIEQQQAMPKQSPKSSFTIGLGYGKLLGALEAQGIAHQPVRPRQWKDKVLRSTAKDKDAAIAHAHRIAPGVDLKPGQKRTAHDGMADAICLADYAQRLMKGEV